MNCDRCNSVTENGYAAAKAGGGVFAGTAWRSLCIPCHDAWLASRNPELLVDAGRYDTLLAVFLEAVAQAATGKGAERHDPNGEPYEDQQIVQLSEWMGSNHFNIGQACKKAIESCGMEPEPARRELLGAINYLAAAVIVLDRMPEKETT